MSEASESKDQKEKPEVKGPSGSSPFKDDRPLSAFPPHKATGEYEGKPYHGPRVDLKDKDPEHKRPQRQMRAHVRQFNLAEKKDMEMYEEIAQGVVEGRFTISFEERIYDQSIMSWRVLIRWAEVYMGLPKRYGPNQQEHAKR